MPRAHKESLRELGLLAKRREDEAEGCRTSFLHYPMDGSRGDGMRLFLEKHSDNIKRAKVTRRTTPVGDTERNVHKKGGEVMGKGSEWCGISTARDCPDSLGHGPEQPAVAVSKGLD